MDNSKPIATLLVLDKISNSQNKTKTKKRKSVEMSLWEEGGDGERIERKELKASKMQCTPV